MRTLRFSNFIAPFIATICCSVVFTLPAAAASVFINEIHYANAGTDSGEAIEIAGPAGTDLTGWSLVLYNGANGAVYNTTLLSGAIPDLASGFGVTVVNYPVNGIQSGAPDGIALVNASNQVVQFLSYEGSFIAVGGPADGVISTDIGVAETGTTAVGASLQLTGTGTHYADFTWNSAAPNTFGNTNIGQSFAVAQPPISSCGQPATQISQIQGSADVSPLVGQSHAVEAVVVGDFQGGASLNGFFLQEQQADQDNDAATSEGLFVASNSPDVSVGDVVRATGTVAESFGLTTLTSISATEVCASGVSVTPVNVTLPFDAPTNNAERYEGMSVVLSQTLSVSDNSNLGRFGEVLVSANHRLFIPTQVAAPGAAALAVQAQNDRNRLIISDSLSAQNPNPVTYPSPGLSASNTLRNGDTITGATGVLSFGFGSYRLEPTQVLKFVAANPRPSTPQLPGIGSLRVASFNVLNFFNGDGNGGGFPTSRGADTTAEFQRQKDKIVSAIQSLNANIIGLMEIENDGYGSQSAIAELTNALNAIAGSGTYAFVNPKVSQIGTDEIAVGLLYKPSKVSLVGGAKILDSSVDARFIDTKSRPVLAQTFQGKTSNKTFTLAVNHFKSKGSACNDVGDPDLGDGQGNCNITRTNAARALADWLATDPTSSGDPDFLVIGDLNSYAQEDPISALRSASYVNLIETRLDASAYSFVFNGQSGYLDHALAIPSLARQVTGIVDSHINADEPRVLDYNVEFKTAAQVASFYNADAYRSSDHDPIVIELLVAGDLDNDGDVDGYDRNVFRSKLGKCASASGFLAEADYDRDNCVTYVDYRIWYVHYRAYQSRTSVD